MNVDAFITIFGLLFGTGGAIFSFIYWNENKQLKKNEVKKEQYQAESTYIENLDKAAEFFKEAVEFQKNQMNEMEKYHNDRYSHLEETIKLFKEQVELYRDQTAQNQVKIKTLDSTVKSLQKQITENQPLICFDKSCLTRQISKMP